jgi:hypothetical protein
MAYITSEVTFAQAGVGGPGFGQLVASAALQSITVVVTCLTAITSGAPSLNLDLLFGDNQNANLNPNLDNSWASNAVTNVVAVPTSAGQSASAVVAGSARGVRANVPTWATPTGSFKIQLAARDIA